MELQGSTGTMVSQFLHVLHTTSQLLLMCSHYYLGMETEALPVLDGDYVKLKEDILNLLGMTHVPQGPHGPQRIKSHFGEKTMVNIVSRS